MEGMDLKFTPVVARCLLHLLSMFGPMAGTSWTHIIIIISIISTSDLQPSMAIVN